MNLDIANAVGAGPSCRPPVMRCPTFRNLARDFTSKWIGLPGVNYVGGSAYLIVAENLG
jgi:hypothetical protein